MKISVNDSNLQLHYSTRILLQRMLSPLCGLDQRISFLMRSHLEPHFMTAGAELTGVHVLRNQPKQAGYYHIGGGGVVLEEAVIRSLGETIERYSQLVSEIHNRHNVVTASYDRVADRGERVIAPDKLLFFSETQFSRPGFPFQPFSRDNPMGWVKAPSLVEDSDIWIPAQLILVGYTVKQVDGERWLLPAVTTGSAAHTSREHALRNALLELIQIDSVMGHWYSSTTASRIVLDKRTKPLERLIEQQFSQLRPIPKFYWLPNPDLSGMIVACVIKENPGNIPAVVVGLGSDLKLLDAMYKALLEAVGVTQLAKITLWDYSIGERAEIGNEIDPEQIFDLDQNVAFYSIPENSSYIDSRFADHSSIQASDLPPDSTLDTREEIRLLVNSFRDTDKELILLDLTTDDVRQLGFTALRVWSPDTISLSLPSAPPSNHPRFKTYGGFHFEHPHPYP